MGEDGSSSEDSPASGGAFNPETGEINWDCPCLGGMAHGPCGPEFREAFSCFVYSDAEPKGVNCVEKFQNMQNCFKAHPEIYADGGDVFILLLESYTYWFLQEIMNDDDEEQPPQLEAPSTDSNATNELNTPTEGQVSP